MINWRIDPAKLSPYLPRHTELDFWQGDTFISLVGFHFTQTRVMGIAWPGHRDFEEVNLRFYVRHQHQNETRRGVVFIKEIVPKRIIAALARTIYGENYVALPMSRASTATAHGRSLAYHWREQEQASRLIAQTLGQPATPPADSEAAYITEHYWGYTRQRSGRTIEYQVEHPPWRVWHTDNASFEGDAARDYPAAIVPVLRETPSSAFVAEGSDVNVYPARRIGGKP